MQLRLRWQGQAPLDMCICGAKPSSKAMVRKLDGRIIACPHCDDHLDRGTADLSCQQRKTTIAEAIRNRMARQEAKRKKQER